MARAGQKRKIKFWRYYEQWIETYKHGSVAGVTYVKYQMTARNIKKLMPDVMLDQLTRDDIQLMINRYGTTHKIQTVRDFFHHVEGPLQDAVYEGWIDRDPCYKVQMKSFIKKRHKRKKWLEADEVKRLGKELKADNTGYGDFLDFILRTGLRFAEALGVTPKDIDLQKQTVYINKTMNYKSTSNDGQYAYGEMMPTKNKYSVRILSLDDQALTDITKHLKGVSENESIIQHWYDHYYYSEEELAEKGHAKIFNSTWNKVLKDMCIKANAHPITVHGLRHTHASLLIANRVSIQSVAKRLGHANTETTQQTYIHLLDKLANEDRNKIKEVMQTI